LWIYVGPTPYSGLWSIHTAQGIDTKNCLSCWPNGTIDYAPTPSSPSYPAQGFDIKNCLSCWPIILPLRSAPTRQLIYTGSIPTCQLPHACGLVLAPFPVAALHDPQNYGLRHDYFGPINMIFLKQLRHEKQFLSQLPVPRHHGICSDLVGPTATWILTSIGIHTTRICAKTCDFFVKSIVQKNFIHLLPTYTLSFYDSGIVFRVKRQLQKPKEKVPKILLLLFFSGKIANRSKIPKSFSLQAFSL
jgi:hypothetical protein